MNFCWITLNVSNMEKSLKFYHEIIGLKLKNYPLNIYPKLVWENRKKHQQFSLLNVDVFLLGNSYGN